MLTFMLLLIDILHVSVPFPVDTDLFRNVVQKLVIPSVVR